MISVFAGFILGPDAMVKEIGFGLAFAVLIDAFLIRMTLIPAVLGLFGAKAWWLPRWLDRVLPNTGVEGRAKDEADLTAAPMKHWLANRISPHRDGTDPRHADEE